jgi:hypothetical protein
LKARRIEAGWCCIQARHASLVLWKGTDQATWEQESRRVLARTICQGTDPLGIAFTSLLNNKQQGSIYDNPKSAKAIASFVQIYSINLNELLEPDIKKYPTFNEFFYR